MTLRELLQELRVNLLRDTSDLRPGEVDDRLYTDAMLLSYLKDAERRFCRQTQVLIDSNTPLITQVPLVEAVKTYKLHPSVHQVISVKYHLDSTDLQRSGHNFMHSAASQTDEIDFTRIANSQPANDRPLAYFVDETTVSYGQNASTITVYPAPSAAVAGNILYLRVTRVPTTDYSLKNLNEESQVPEDYQLDTLSWAAYRATRNWDGDKGAAAQSNSFKNDFLEAVQNARADMRRKAFAPFKVLYGTNGFVWDK